MKTDTAIILAAGIGKRLENITHGKMPKHMLPVPDSGKPVIGHVLDQLLFNNIYQVVITIGNDHESIIQYIEPNYKNKADIIFVTEQKFIGGGGGIKNAAKEAGLGQENILTIHGDSLNTVDLGQMIMKYSSFYENRALMALAPHLNPYGERIVKMNSDLRIFETIITKERKSIGYVMFGNKYMTNSGVLLVNTQALDLIPDENEFHFNDLIEALIQQQLLFAFPTNAQHFNVGTPEIYATACQKWNPNKIDGSIEKSLLTYSS